MSAGADVVVRVEGAGKRFRYRPHAPGTLTLKSALLDALLLRPRPAEVVVEALADVSFEVRRGEALGLVGRNGAGKTTLLRLVAGTFRPDRGRVEVVGRRGLLIELGAGFHPELSGLENAEIAALVAGASAAEARERLPAMTAFADLGERLHAPVRTWSAGMGVRLGFAVAAGLDPDVLVVDEVLAVGDETFQQKCRARVAELRARGTAVVVASHDLLMIEALCERALWLDAGRARLAGPAREVVAAYRAASAAVPAQAAT